MKPKLVKTLLATLAALLMFTACTSRQTQPAAGGYGWWSDTVFYEIFVRSYYDSNDDGIGDINGLIEKLDYLNDGSTKTIGDLGVTGLWLMPIMPSPSYHGYDVTDYYSVNPEYGTNEDFKRLMDEAHKRGIRVIIDLVLNHTSSKHPWFQEASDPNSPYRDWYVWSEADPGGENWYPTANGYYYAYFWDQMPDLNYTNPEVVAEMNKVAKFWLEEMGVDGFRLDAARHLIEEGDQDADTTANHQYWKNFRLVYKDANPEAIAVGEVWTANVSVEDYLQGDELDLAFNFDLASQILEKVNGGYGKQLQRDIRSTVEAFKPGTYATFLTNHDQNRVMNEVAGKWERAKMAATVLLTIPGTPFLYYGEEIGMTGAKPDEKIRTPMQWSAEKSAGFSTTFPWESINADYTEKNVAQQTNDLDSLLSLYRSLIYLRSNHPALRTGDFIPVDTSNNAVLGFLRVHEEEVVLVLINLGTRSLTDLTVSLAKSSLSGAYSATTIFGSGQPGQLTFDSQGGFQDYHPTAELSPSSSLIIQLKK